MPTIQVLGEFTGYTLNDLLRKTLKLCFQRVTTDGNGTVTGDFARFTQADITEALNEAIQDLALDAQLLQTYAIIRLRNKVREYPLPKDLWMLQHAYYYDSGGTPWPLSIDSYRYLHEAKNYLRTLTGANPPESVYLADSYGNIRKLGVYPMPNEDGDAVTMTGVSGVVTGSSLGTFVGELTGTHNGTGNNAKLVDTTRNFVTLGVVVGEMVFNATDGSKCQITAISTTTNPNDTLEGTLSGGTDNDWDVGDSYVVPTGEYGEIVQIDGSETYVFSDALGGVASFSIPTKNLLIQYYRYPAIVSDTSHYPEIYKYFQKALPYGAAAALLLGVAVKSDMQVKAAQYKGEFKDYIDKARRYEISKHARNRTLRIRPIR